MRPPRPRGEIWRLLLPCLEELEAFGLDLEPVSVSRSEPNIQRGASLGALPPASGTAALAEVSREIQLCTACGLHQNRKRVVPGQGAADCPPILFVGEAPGASEDRQGLAFVGRAGQLLTRMIAAMGFERSQVFIANLLKCRPPDNRNPRPEEVAACLPFLRRQVAIIRPRMIVALGGHAGRNLLGCADSVGRMRGRVHLFGELPLVVTYHPSYLLRAPHERRKAWEDLKLALSVLGLSPPPRRRP